MSTAYTPSATTSVAVASLRKALLTRSLYGYLKTDRLSHILQALDQRMHTAKGENYEIKGKLTIEHLLPQKWEANWPLPPGADVAAATETRDNLVHTLGNLTLVTGELNAALSNGAWSTKHEEISTRRSKSTAASSLTAPCQPNGMKKPSAPGAVSLQSLPSLFGDSGGTEIMQAVLRRNTADAGWGQARRPQIIWE